MTTTAKVAAIPACDLPHPEGKPPAYADAHLGSGMGWGYVCKRHFDHFNCQLGWGRGQVLEVDNG